MSETSSWEKFSSATRRMLDWKSCFVLGKRTFLKLRKEGRISDLGMYRYKEYVTAFNNTLVPNKG